MIVTNYTRELQPGLSSSSCYSGKETRGLRHQVPQKHGIENLVDHVMPRVANKGAQIPF